MTNQKPAATIGGNNNHALAIDATLRHQTIKNIQHTVSQFCSRHIQTLLEQADHVLFELAAKATDESLNYLYLDTISRMRNKRDVLRIGFIKQVDLMFDAVDGNAVSASNATPAAIASVVDDVLFKNDDALESDIAMSVVARHTEKNLKSSIEKLFSQWQQLVASDKSANDLVFSPLKLCGAWKLSVYMLRAPTKVNLVMYKLFSKFVLNEIESLYEQISNQLAAIGIKPTVQPKQPAATTSKAVSQQIDTSRNAVSTKPSTTKPTQIDDRMAAPAKAPTKVIAPSNTTTNSASSTKPTPAGQSSAHDVVAQQMRKKMDLHKTQPVIRDFIQSIWVPVLTEIRTQKGTDNPAWASANEAVDELLWAFATPNGKDRVEKLLELIPKLLSKLQAGLSMVKYDRVKKEQLFNLLLALHASTIREKKSSTTPRAAVAKTTPTAAPGVPVQ